MSYEYLGWGVVIGLYYLYNLITFLIPAAVGAVCVYFLLRNK